MKIAYPMKSFDILMKKDRKRGVRLRGVGVKRGIAEPDLKYGTAICLRSGTTCCH
jgi:hypothetical protein